MFFWHCILSLMLVIPLQEVWSETVEVTISDGDIIGQSEITSKNTSYYSFKGIPFAEPPVGPLRFASPQPVSPWSDPLNASEYGNQCVQFGSDDYLGTDTLYGDEDCLYINVFTPDVNATDLPVLVWIYGGVFIFGNGSNFPPDNFIDSGMVYVSFNYRLGVLGFLSTEDEACPGNWGIKDQVKALEWVQKNIAKFGGNPKNVTIFGESAGSVSVHILVQSSAATGLFQKAIMNSGSTLNLWSLNTRATKITKLTGVNLGVASTNTTKLVENLRGVEVETLVRTGWRTGWLVFLSNGLRGLPFAPVLEPDVEGAVYVNASDKALSEGNFNTVPILIGFNSQEALAAGSVPFYLDLYLFNYDISQDKLTPWSLTQTANKRVAAGFEIKLHYFQYNLLSLDRQGLINFISADQFNRPIRKSAQNMANYTTVYYYEFGYQGYASNNNRTYEGTAHAEDLDYFFIKSTLSYTKTDLKVSATLVLLWTNFAKFGNPTPDNYTALNNTLWPAIDPRSSNVNCLAINESISQQVNPKQDDWKFYLNLWKEFSDSTTKNTTY